MGIRDAASRSLLNEMYRDVSFRVSHDLYKLWDAQRHARFIALPYMLHTSSPAPLLESFVRNFASSPEFGGHVKEQIKQRFKFNSEFILGFLRRKNILCDEKIPDIVDFLDFSSGDSHLGGARTIKFKLRNGKTAYYKPRGLDAHNLFHDISRELKIDYIYNEHLCDFDAGYISYEKPYSYNQSEDYYYKYGFLLALLGLLGATDMHFQNLMCYNSSPTIIDDETILHPRLKPHIDWRSTFKATGLLPLPDKQDFSPLGARPGTYCNQKILSYEAVDTEEMQATLIQMRTPAQKCRPRGKISYRNLREGLIDGLHHIKINMNVIKEIVESRNKLATRVIIRNSSFYRNIISFGMRRNINGILYENCHFPEAVIEYESRCLNLGDIPYFCSPINGKSLIFADTEIANFYGQSGLELIFSNAKHIEKLGKENLLELADYCFPVSCNSLG